MSAHGRQARIPAPGGPTRVRPFLRARLLPLIKQRLRDRAFWNVQAMMLAVTAGHLVIELSPVDEPLQDDFNHLHHVPPLFYALPIVYASLRFGREGGVLAGLQAAVFTLPNVALAHRDSVEWIVELSQITTVVVVGLFLSNRVEQEIAERRRAEQMAARLSLANQQITRAQEVERSRIARELHDETVQALIVLGHRLDEVSATPDLPAGVRDSLSETRQMTDTILENARHFSRDLRPSVLDHLGLAAAVAWLTKDLGARTGLRTQMRISGRERRLTPEIELALFRIAQEALHNAERHSGGDEATVTLSFEGATVVLTVADNGHGFDPSPPADLFLHRGQMGIMGMQERANLVGGRLTIESSPEHGTRVIATVSADPEPADSA